MKALFLYLSLLPMLLGMTAPASARDMAIGLSPYLEPAAADLQVKSVLQFLTETLEPGDSCFVFDAYNIQSLGTFVVPNKSAYRHPKAKIQANRQMVATMLKFTKASRKPQGGGEPSVIGAIRLPQALRFIGMNYPAAQESDLILLGSPLYDDPKEKDFTMTRNRIPGDGHFVHSRSTTPYGIKGQSSMLAKRRVHLGFSDESWKQDDHHGYFVHRFWTLFIEGQGGVLSTFTSDLPTLFQRVKAKAPLPKHEYTIEQSDKLEMILLRPPVLDQAASIYERPLSTMPLSSELVRQAHNVEVGITWECGACDLDLYGQMAPGATALSFINTQTSEGQYFKDWTRSPRATNGYETLAYRVPLNLQILLLAVNFYGGQSSGGVKGEIRISLDGQTYGMAFHLPAQEGNGGGGRDETLTARQAHSPHWLVINPLEVVGLQEKSPALAQR